MSKKQLTEEELKELREINERYSKLVTYFGECELSIYNLNEQVNKLKEEKEGIMSDFKSLKEKNDALFTSLSEKYGTGRINLETGDIEEA
jgi:uncharacterized coiled-coil DUF342 family protein